MKFTQVLPVAFSLAAVALSANVNVTVGPSLKFTPDSVTAQKGDVVQFHFGSGHNVVSGAFNSPCQPDNKIYSGNPKEGDVFSVTINDTEPIWIYCAVGHHCESGMAMVINPPSNENIAAYQKAASSVGSSSSPQTVVGGVLNAPAASSSSSMSSSMASASASSTSMASGASASASSTSHSASGSSTSSTATASASSSTNGASKALTASTTLFGSAFAVLAVAFGLTV